MPSASKSRISFFFETPVNLAERTRLKSFIESLFKKEGKPLAYLNYIFCDDKMLLGINQEYLAHDDYTDIISFELSEKSAPAEGEIYISVERFKDNAVKLHTSFKE